MHWSVIIHSMSHLTLFWTVSDFAQRRTRRYAPLACVLSDLSHRVVRPLCGRRNDPFVEPLLNGVPVHVRKEGVDILRPISWSVIEYERVFPDVHYKNGIESADVPDFVQRDPVI